MYLEHYGLKAKPFQISADPRFLWLGSKHKEALAILKYGIFDNRGFLLLSGDVGTGKTTLIHALIREIGADTIVASVPDPGLALMDFYRYIARVFKIKAPFDTKEQFLEVFEAFLIHNESKKKKVLLIIDEAQRLTSELLEEIRLLSNIEKSYSKLLNIFFVGQNEFNDIILEQKNRPLRQRITINYNIDPLEQHEVMEYINFRLRVAGCNVPLFTGDAVREVFAFSEGYPRLINIICDHALLTGFVQGVARISGNIVSECAEELRIQTVRPTPPPQQPPPQPAYIPPTVYPSPATHSDKDKGLSSAQTLLVVIIGLLCFVAGLMVFSLRDRGPESDVAAGKRVDEAAPLATQSEDDTRRSPSASEDGSSRGNPDDSPEGTDAAAAQPMKANPDQLPSGDRASSRSGARPVSTPSPLLPATTTASNIRLEDLLSDADALMVNFKIDSNELTAEDMQDLDRVAALLNSRDDIRAEVTGYTDAVGNVHYNLKVSEFRANIVKTYLVGKGVEADRLIATGRGAAEPIDTNDTIEGRRRNRRVEIQLKAEAALPAAD